MNSILDSNNHWKNGLSSFYSPTSLEANGQLFYATPDHNYLKKPITLEDTIRKNFLSSDNDEQLSSSSDNLNAHLDKSHLKKTSLCKYWIKGTCTKPFCDFAHGDNELKSTPNIWKTTICKHWRSGTCPNGDMCRHAHGEKDLRCNTNSNSYLSLNQIESHCSSNLNHNYKHKDYSSQDLQVSHKLQPTITQPSELSKYNKTKVEEQIHDNQSDLQLYLQIIASHLLLHAKMNCCTECMLLHQKLQSLIPLKTKPEIEADYDQNSPTGHSQFHTNQFINTHAGSKSQLNNSASRSDSENLSNILQDLKITNTQLYDGLANSNLPAGELDSEFFKHYGNSPTQYSINTPSYYNPINSILSTPQLSHTTNSMQHPEHLNNITGSQHYKNNEFIFSDLKITSTNNSCDRLSSQGETRSNRFSASEVSFDDEFSDFDFELHKYPLPNPAHPNWNRK